MTYTCPHCGKEFDETVAFNGICPGCHKGFDFANLNPKITSPKNKQPIDVPLNNPYPETSDVKSVAKDYLREAGKFLRNRTPTQLIVGGFVIFILLLAMVGAFNGPSPEEIQQTKSAQQETVRAASEKQKQADEYDRKLANKVLEGSGEIIEKLTYKVDGAMVRYTIDFRENISDSGIAANVKGLCDAFRQLYSGRYVDVEGKRNGLTIREAEFSPFTNRIVLK